MQVFLNILFLILGIFFLIKGADYFVVGASGVAKRLKVSPLIIGLTIVAIGTSLPELAVSITAAISGSVDMSVGNVIGSNMANMLLIIGIVACFSPIVIQKSSKKFDLPFMLAVTGVLLLFCADFFVNGGGSNIITRTEAIILLLLLVYYLVRLVLDAKRGQKENFKTGDEVFEEELKRLCDEAEAKTEKQGKSDKKENFFKKIRRKIKEFSEGDLPVWKIVLFLILGLGAVVLGGEAVSRTAQNLAIMAGMSEALVGLTIVALGTSLPELVTSVVAAKKGETDLVIGNVIGSNIMNILLILGTVGVIKNINVAETILMDLLILLCFTAIFTILSLSRKKIGRITGVIYLLMYFSYIAFAIVRNYCF